MVKKFLLSILALCVSVAYSFGQNQEVAYKENVFGLDYGIGGSKYNSDWWGKKTGAATTFDIGIRYLHNFSPYFGVDFFKFKPVNFGFKTIDDDVSFVSGSAQLMTGVRGYSPTFTKQGMRAFGAFRLGGGLFLGGFFEDDDDFGGGGGGFCYEFELGLYLNRTIFVAFAYNHQGGSMTFDDDYKTKIDAGYAAFRIGFDFGKVKTHSSRGGGSNGAGNSGGAGVSDLSLLQSGQTSKPAVTESEQQPLYTIEDMKQFIRDNVDVRGKKISAIQQVTFEFGKSTLNKNDKLYLNEIVDLMKQNSRIHIQINGHTDNVGTEVFNQNLSRDRAKSVYDYLASQGIATSRLSYEYFGSRLPIADNYTEEGRAINRRVEFEIISQ